MYTNTAAYAQSNNNRTQRKRAYRGREHQAKRRQSRPNREPLVRTVRYAIGLDYSAPPIAARPPTPIIARPPPQPPRYATSKVVWTSPTPQMMLAERPALYDYLGVLLEHSPITLVRLAERVAPRDIPLLLKRVPLWHANSYLFALAPDASAAMFLLAARRSLSDSAYHYMRPNPDLWRVTLEAMLHAIDCGGVHPPRPSNEQLEEVFRAAQAGAPARTWRLEEFGAPHCPTGKQAVEDETTESECDDNALKLLHFRKR